MLMQQRASLTELLSRAHIVTAREVDPERIGFGSRFRAINLTLNSEETYTVLGRWEANPEQHILSHLAPLAQQFNGHGAGDEVTIDHPGGGSTQYRIVAVENALAGGEWDSPGNTVRATVSEEPATAE